MGSHSLELIMSGLVVLAACICASSAQIIARAALPGHQSHQFHAQDEFGQFSFGHAGGPSARTESRNAYGVTQGSYQYVDAYGIIQTVNYVSDAAGFRVAGSNLPVGPVAVVDTPEVAAAKAEFQAAFDAATTAAAAAPEEPAVEEVAEEAAVVAEERKKRDADEVCLACWSNICRWPSCRYWSALRRWSALCCWSACRWSAAIPLCHRRACCCCSC